MGTPLPMARSSIYSKNAFNLPKYYSDADTPSQERKYAARSKNYDKFLQIPGKTHFSVLNYFYIEINLVYIDINVFLIIKINNQKVNNFLKFTINNFSSESMPS